ncbi:MAG: hypothetical protein ACI9TH_003555 [Kiritimatiellia bacterium]|jgi:hypothetical protein
MSQRLLKLLNLFCVLLTCAGAHAQGGPDAFGAATYPNLRLRGFADINYAERSNDKTDSSNFSQGQLTLHLTSPISDHFTFFSEITMTASGAAATDSHEDTYDLEVQRGVIKYTHSDLLNLSAGRYHTPINYWNKTYHHGLWLQTPVTRPEMIRFGGGFIPDHFEGALAEGSHGSTLGRFGYTLGVGNGRSEVITRAGDRVDVNENRAWVAGVSASPRVPGDLEFGISTYVDKIEQEEGAPVDEAIYDAYLVWQIMAIEFFAEFAEVQHEPTDAMMADTDSDAYTVMLAYTLPAYEGILTPYVRFDDLSIHNEDTVFAGLRDVEGYSVGIRVDAADLLALKFEYRDLKDERDGDVTLYQAQVAFTF